ncbi:F-box/WD repeat-containing protein 2 isoform X2 [Amblyraja radiata]|uniref:F-box/WD repeat-containing protein 2 isoform X2 n=1 Tax=Amblyraja radiata TaxID=386614 RepID=UPI001402B843|nr:F-box/WD repeat-containing protein 2 isoform X2 [Amblyraja radiata]
MERKDFNTWLESLSGAFITLTDAQKNESLDHLISLSGAVQLRHLSNNLETLLKRDFLKLLPLELSFYLLKWLDPPTLLNCCLVCKQWNKVISICTEVWQEACRSLGWQIDDTIEDTLHWKKIYLKAVRRIKQLQDKEAFETSSLIGHSARVYALYYKDGLLCTVFSVDYSDELDTLVSGSADFTVKVWSLSTGICLNTLTEHTEWVTKVVLQVSHVESVMHKPGDYILLSADKYEIKVWPIGREVNCKCLKTLAVSNDRSICLQPRVQFDGKHIVCASDLGLYQWDFASYDIIRVIRTPDSTNLSLLSLGEVFALLFDSRYLYIMDLRTERVVGRWPLPAYRKSKRGSSFLAGETAWLSGLNGKNDSGLVFATSMPDHSIHLVLWRENG